MQPHEQRVLDEKRELDNKIELLALFTHGTVFNELPDEDKTLLTKQHSAMSIYSHILGQRIARFVIH